MENRTLKSHEPRVNKFDIIGKNFASTDQFEIKKIYVLAPNAKDTSVCILQVVVKLFVKKKDGSLIDFRCDVPMAFKIIYGNRPMLQSLINMAEKGIEIINKTFTAGTLNKLRIKFENIVKFDYPDDVAEIVKEMDEVYHLK